MQSKLIIPIILILVSFVWAGSFIVVKTITEELDPIDLGFLRFLVATPLMFFVLFLRNKKSPIPIKELPLLSILGLTGVTILYVFQFVGIKYTNASTSAVLINTNVIFIALLSALLLKEELSKKRVTGISLSFFGVIIIVLSNLQYEQFNLNNIFIFGSILILLSALCWAVYSIVGKQLLQTYDALTVTTYAFGLGTLFYIPIIFTDIISTIGNLSVNGWLAIFYLAILCSAFGYIGWYYALKKIDASKAAVFLNLIPLFAIIMSFFLGEKISIIFLIGATLIIYGVYLTQKS
jgi:drug/metabolite transporter (DMT)-like permease